MSKELRRRSAELAARGAWTEVDALLSEADPEVVLESRELAYRRGEALFHLGRMERLAEFGERFEARARERADARGIMGAQNLQGIAAFELGRVEEARTHFEQLMELAEAEDEVEMLARAANNMGALANLGGEPRVALSQYRLALALYQRRGQIRGLAQLHHNVGISFRDLSLLNDAVDAYKRCAEFASAIDYQPLVILSTIGRAEAELRRGDVWLGASLAEHGVRGARELEDPISRAEALRVRALARALAAQDGDDREGPADGGFPEALEDLEEARELASEAGSLLVLAEVERDAGELLAQLGDAETAHERLERAEELFERLGARGACDAARDRIATL